MMPDSNLTLTHCQSRHLTSFATGLIELPPPINFDYVWSQTSFEQNIVIYVAIIAFVCVLRPTLLLQDGWSRFFQKGSCQKNADGGPNNIFSNFSFRIRIPR